MGKTLIIKGADFSENTIIDQFWAVDGRVYEAAANTNANLSYAPFTPVFQNGLWGNIVTKIRLVSGTTGSISVYKGGFGEVTNLVATLNVATANSPQEFDVNIPMNSGEYLNFQNPNDSGKIKYINSDSGSTYIPGSYAYNSAEGIESLNYMIINNHGGNLALSIECVGSKPNKKYYFGLPDIQYNIGTSTSNTRTGFSQRIQPMQGKTINGIRIKVDTSGTLPIYKGNAYNASSGLVYVTSCTATGTGLQDIDFASPVALGANEYIVLGAPNDSGTLRFNYSASTSQYENVIMQRFYYDVGKSSVNTVSTTINADYYTYE